MVELPQTSLRMPKTDHYSILVLEAVKDFESKGATRSDIYKRLETKDRAIEQVLKKLRVDRKIHAVRGSSQGGGFLYISPEFIGDRAVIKPSARDASVHQKKYGGTSQKVRNLILESREEGVTRFDLMDKLGIKNVAAGEYIRRLHQRAEIAILEDVRDGRNICVAREFIEYREVVDKEQGERIAKSEEDQVEETRVEDKKTEVGSRRQEPKPVKQEDKYGIPFTDPMVKLYMKTYGVPEMYLKQVKSLIREFAG